MSLLSTNATPAELVIGCSFAENFESNQAVIENGGVITGTPTINFGGTFNGTTDYLSYTLSEDFLYSDNLSFVVEFTPNFVSDDDLSHVLLWNNTSDIRLYKYSDNALIASFGGTSPIYLSHNLWSPYWNEYKRNAITIISTSGSTKMYLNGTLLPTSGSAWTKSASTTLFIGDNALHDRKYKGVIHSVKIFNTLLTAQDATNFYNNSTYNYRNKSVLDLTMTMASHDPTNVQSLDVSGKGRNAEFGDGSTPTTYPTKQTKHGYDFDGGDYLEATLGTGLNVGNSGSLTFVIEFSPDYDYDLDDVVYLYGTTSESIYAVIKQNNAASNVMDIYMGNEKWASIASATYSPYWKKGQRNVMIISGEGGDGSTNTGNVWLNGNSIYSDTPEWYPATTVTSITIGASYSHGNFYDGKIHSFQILPIAVTELQMWDIMIDLQNSINQI